MQGLATWVGVWRYLIRPVLTGVIVGCIVWGVGALLPQSWRVWWFGFVVATCLAIAIGLLIWLYRELRWINLNKREWEFRRSQQRKLQPWRDDQDAA